MFLAAVMKENEKVVCYLKRRKIYGWPPLHRRVKREGKKVKKENNLRPTCKLLTIDVEARCV